MDSIIISGGRIESDFALEFLKKKKGKVLVIAADRGLEFCSECGIIPDWAVGDFDSVASEVLKKYERISGLRWRKLVPEKDDSDTQSAMNLAIELGSKKVEILGGTGSRLDHVLANLGLLSYGEQKGITVALLDANNYVCLLADRETILRREEQFGDYVSFFPVWGEVRGLTLEGFKYPLCRHHLTVFDSGLTVSNEIVDEEAKIQFEKGPLFMIMSKD
ncbi:MAG: thiamine diphosphokinase [Blautia sp.]